MSLRMKHQPQSPKLKEVFVGPPAPEQKASLCSRCGRPVGNVYRVYEQKVDQYGNKKITKGQFEVAHIGIDGRYIFHCEVPGLLDELTAKIREKIAREEANESWEDAEARSKTRKSGKQDVVHLQRTEGVNRVVCGAKGSLWTTLDNEYVTCSNCKRRVSESQGYEIKQRFTTGGPTAESNQPKEGDKSNMSTQQGEATGMSKSEQIKQKIAAAKAKKAAGGQAGGNQGAALVNGGDDGAPMPQATKTGKAAKVQKQQVQASKKEAGPKILNLCGCGCGAGVKSKFVPGHDARLHGWIKKLEKGAMALTDVSALVRDGMFPKVKQGAVKDSEGKVTLQGVLPVVTEADYLAKLKGKGGIAEE